MTLLVVSSPRGRQQFSQDTVLRRILDANRVYWVDDVCETPGLKELQGQIDRLSDLQFDGVVGFGGGSAMDVAKTLNLALSPECRDCELTTLLDQPALYARATSKPLYTIPTTSGTGSEVTPFATVWDHERKKKRSLEGPAIWPQAAFVDSELTDSVPTNITISTGLDAINQAGESIWNRNANSITLGFAIRALKLALFALPRLVARGPHASASDHMAEASLLAGLAISHTRTALCHSISYPITAHFHVPHGLACAFTMPDVLRKNLAADDGRFAQLAQALTGSPDLDGLAMCFDELHTEMGVREKVASRIPSLNSLLDLVPEMLTPERSGNNLAGNVDLHDVLRNAWSRD